jgi:hypothetical protein
MTPNSHTLYASAWLALLVSASTAGCLCPPCPGAVASGPAAAAAAPAASNAAQATSVAASAAAGSKLVIWNGDGEGGGAQGWNSCDQAPTCKTSLGPDSGSGVNGSAALKFHGEGPGWLGMGWNLFGWYPEGAGIDISPYSHLTFQIRVEAKSADAAPEYLGLSLGCSNKNKKDSADIPVERYAKTFADGKWHKVEIPISALIKGAGSQFELQSFWEFRLHTWTGTPKNFDIYLDDITVEKH